MRLIPIILLLISFNVFSNNHKWRGIVIEPEHRCAPYNRDDYPYLQSIEDKIIKQLNNKIYSPYTGQYFKSKKETDIEHIIAVAQAHDSGLCKANKVTRKRFASDIRNLTLASPTINRFKKKAKDADSWLPKKNKCWFAARVIEVRKAYNLTIDSKELIALEKVISKCKFFTLIYY